MKVAVLGAGSMGNGIAHVSALGGHSVVVRDVEQDLVEEGLKRIEANLEEGIEREKITPAEKEDAIERITGTVSLHRTSFLQPGTHHATRGDRRG